jgi:4-hydroxybenzoyl-CoA thioesterase
MSVHARHDEPVNRTFSWQRRIGFGECDPARVIYAPRGFDYAVEAVEAWWRGALGGSWSDLEAQRRLEARVVRVRCEYLRPLVAGQVLHVAVSTVGVGATEFTLRVVGELAPGHPGFRAHVVMSFADRVQLRSVPIPAEYRASIEAWRASHDASSDAAGSERRPARAASGSRTQHMPVSSPGAGRTPPFVREHRVTCGECGASGSAYAPRMIERAVETVGEWYETVVGISWFEQCLRGRGTPFVDIRCDYLERIVAGQEITMAVTIPRLGTASIEYAVDGHGAGGVPCFRAHMIACHISEESGRPTAAPFPGSLRERIVDYQRRSGGAA